MASKQNIVAVASLLGGAMVWGLMWYPFRALQGEGVSAELATLLAYGLALLFGMFAWRTAGRELTRSGGWGLVMILSSGWTNLGYVVAVVHGEVMRVLLLFYLAPLWTVILAYLLLGEKLNRYGYAVIALSLAGAWVMLGRPGGVMPLPQNGAEWIGLSAGFAFALTNVLVRRIQHLTVSFKAVGVWFGTASLTLVLVLSQGGLGASLGHLNAYAWLMLVSLGLVICATTLIVLYGLTGLPANRAIVLFLSELVFAAVSSYLLAREEMSAREIAGAVLIVSASLLSGRMQHPS